LFPTARSATRILGPYWIPNIRTNAYQVYTNTGSAGSYRAIGAPQVIFAGESQIEILAAKLGMDPAELRAKNLLKKGQELRPGLKGIDANLAASLKTLVRASHWRQARKNKHAAIGMGCAADRSSGVCRTNGAIRCRAAVTSEMRGRGASMRVERAVRRVRPAARSARRRAGAHPCGPRRPPSRSAAAVRA